VGKPDRVHHGPQTLILCQNSNHTAEPRNVSKSPPAVASRIRPRGDDTC